MGVLVSTCIGAEETPACQECGADVDSAQTCWKYVHATRKRQVLKDTIGNDTSLTVIIGVLVEEERGRMAITRFCEEVMATKVITERSWEICDPARREMWRERIRTERRAGATRLLREQRAKSPLNQTTGPAVENKEANNYAFREEA